MDFCRTTPGASNSRGYNSGRIRFSGSPIVLIRDCMVGCEDVRRLRAKKAFLLSIGWPPPALAEVTGHEEDGDQDAFAGRREESGGIGDSVVLAIPRWNEGR